MKCAIIITSLFRESDSLRMAFATAEPEIRERFRRVIDEYFEKRFGSVELFIFDTPEEMLASVEENSYDLVFFDMDYSGKAGVNYIYKMRRFNPDIPVVILHFTKSGRVESVFINPVTCIMEKFTTEEFSPMLDIVVGDINSNQQRSVLVKTMSDNIARIVPINTIVFVEANAHKVCIHLSNGEILETYGPMKKFSERLERFHEFLYPHRSYIVNSIYVWCITDENIYLRISDDVVPVARGKFKSIKESYDEYFRGFDKSLHPNFPRF